MLAPVLWRYLWRQLWHNPGRTSLTILGVALGVAITLAIQLTNHTAVQQFKQSVDLVSGRANASILPTTSRFIDEQWLHTLTPIWEAGGQFTPVLDIPAAYEPHTFNPSSTVPQIPLRVLGVDMMVDARFRPLEFATPPEHATDIFNQDHRHETPVYIPQRLATEWNLGLNAPFSILIGERVVSCNVAGILKNQGIGQAYGGDVIVTDIGNAQAITQEFGHVSRIDIMSPPNTNNASGWSQSFEQSITELLPEHLALSTVTDQTRQGKRLLAAFHTNLTALSFIGLLVGMFLMYNTMSIAILRRQQDIGILRTLALNRRHIAKLFGVELLIYGVLGSALGCGMGLVMAQATTHLVSSTVQMLYTGLPMHQVTWSWPWIGLVFILGAGTTIAAGAIPLWQSTRIAPALAARANSRELSTSFNWCAIAAVVCWIIALFASQQPAVYGLPLWGHVCSLMFIVGSAFWVPMVLPLILQILQKVFSSSTVRIAAAQLLLHRGRTSVAVASLLMAVAMVMSIGVMIHSFRQTVIVWVNQSITADIWIEPEGPPQVEKRLISPKIPALIAAIPGVKAVDPFFEQPIQFKGTPTRLAVGEFSVFEALGNLRFISGRPAAQVMREAIERKGVVVTEPFANQFDIKVNDTITLPTPTGTQSFPVIGVYRDYSSEQGFMVMNRDTYQQYFKPGNELTGIAVYAQPSVDAPTLRRRILEVLPQQTRLSVQTQQGLKEEIFTIFDQTFAITHALHLISVIVAILAIVNTLVSLSLELKREFELLRMIGFSSATIQKIQWVQALCMGWISSLLALPVGVVLSLFLVFVINVQAFHWTIDYQCPPLFLIETMLAVVVVSLLAGVLSSWYLTRTRPSNRK